MFCSDRPPRKGEAVTFDEALEQALEMRRRRGRVSYRALKVQFHLDDDLLEILKEEIVAVHRLGRDQEGTMLVWIGGHGHCRKGLLRRPGHVGGHAPLCRRGAPLPWPGDAGTRGAQLRRSRRAVY